MATGEELVVEEAVAVKSEAIKNTVEDDCASNTIPLPNVSSKTMNKVIEYRKKHLELEEKDELKTSDKNFLKVHQSELCDLIIAANYLDDKELLDALCQEVVDRIKGKTPEEICQEFNIKYDFIPEEEEQVRRDQNAWAFE